jgi:hypothetical protein
MPLVYFKLRKAKFEDPYLRKNAINKKNSHEEYQEKYLKNNISKFYVNIHLQRSFEVTTYVSLSISCDEGALHILIGLERKCKQIRWLVKNEISPCLFLMIIKNYILDHLDEVDNDIKNYSDRGERYLPKRMRKPHSIIILLFIIY